MNKGWIIFIVLVAIVAVIVYAYTGFALKPTAKTTTSVLTTVGASTIGSTSVTTTIPGILVNCSAVYIQGVNPFSKTNATCQWGGGKLGIWVDSGKAFNTTVSIIGTDGKTYTNGTFSYNALTFFANVSLPKQNYTVSLSAGPEGINGSSPFIKLNTTTTAPAIVYSYIYNANFSNGQYTGWNISGSGFGTKPFNLTRANSANVLCYYGSPWKNYPGTFFASTYTCGTSVSPGNLTSEELRVDPKTPFLNFRMISPADNLVYVEVFQVGGNASVVGHFNTYNISNGANVSSTFSNVSLPLTTLSNKIVRIKIVAATVQPVRYVAIGAFTLGNLPNTDKGVITQVNITR
jgi:hypothetical protein